MYKDKNGEYAFGDGYFQTKSDKFYIYCEIRVYLENHYPKVTILSLSRID